MFDVGFAELFLLSLIGLIVLGPERLPAVARTLGGFVRKARISYHNLKRTVEAELAAAEAANPIKDAQKELESVQRQVNELKGQLDQDVAPKMIPEVDGEVPADDETSEASKKLDKPEKPALESPEDPEDGESAHSSAGPTA
ncbi:MAG: Sec-independent protein translocase protein TatB [Xanthomonadales bacterium]|jgi:sec-independent protein translocase protein TatB|nr:Sec-independent protein translocase protein TatB [Xanthomonadales bacterium]